MSAEFESPLLAPDEGPAAHVLNAGGRAPVVLVCEHASRAIPRALNGLGLDAAASRSHAAWDIGGLDLAQALATRLDAPLVASRISRLVYDCNRPPSAPDAVPERSEVFTVPGNTDLSPAARAQRVRDVYDPFRRLLSQCIDARPVPPIIVTIHSFTPVYNGQPRAVELGLLHDSDDRVARHLMTLLAVDSGCDVRLNAPYSATDGVTHTLRDQAIPRALPNVMIEVRNDLIDTPAGVTRMAGILTGALAQTVAHFSATEETYGNTMTQNAGRT